MKKLFLYAALVANAITFNALGQMAALDSTFGNNGYLEVPMGTGTDDGVAIALQSDGKILVAGKVQVGSGLNYDFGLMRLLPDGELDSTFSSDGKVVTPIGTGIDEPCAVAVAPDGKIYVAGYSDNGANYDFALARYLSDGSPDLSFNSTGKLQRDGSGGFDFCTGMALQPDGKIVLVGYAFIGNGYHGIVMRINPDGSPDAGFGTNGTATLNLAGSTEELYAITLQGDGKIVVGGNSTINGTVFSLAVIRLTSSGDLDSTFHNDGMATVFVSPTNNTCTRLHVIPDGKIVATGNGAAGVNRNFLAIRFASNGNVDQGYGTNGSTLLGFGTGDNFCYTSALLSDNKLLMAGTHFNGATLDLALIKLDANGYPDLTFTSNGTLSTDLAGNKDIARGVAIQSDQKILLAGTTENPNFQFMVARYTAGTLTAVGETNLALPAKLYPNPVHSYFQVEFPCSQSDEAIMEIVDLQGKSVWQGTVKVIPSSGMGRTEMRGAESLQQGYYALRVITSEGAWTFRFIKDKE